MNPKKLRIAAGLLAILAVAGTLSGCGRRGGLEPPPNAQVLTTDEEGKVVKPDRPFVLDPLIQ